MVPVRTRARVIKVASSAAENRRKPTFNFLSWAELWEGGARLARRRVVTMGLYSSRVTAMFMPPLTRLKGRNTVGNIPRPVYQVQESGIVVVDIWVDNYGNVKKAVPGGDGTTVMNKALLAAARNAAMETHFNMSKDAPAMQEGRITYYFNLK